MESHPELEVRRSGPVLEIALNRPDKRNALTRSQLTHLLGVLQTVPGDCRLLVFTAYGPVFCAGMDLREMADTTQSASAAELWMSDAELYRNVVETLFRLPIPTLCVVQGPVLAGGVGLVLACDLVLGTASTTFALPEPQRGITASIVMPLLQYRVGVAAASFLLFSGTAVNADEALRIGLIQRQVADSERNLIQPVVDGILKNAPQALRETKRQLQADTLERLQSAWDIATPLSGTIRGSAEAREGLRAFLERRPPNWVATWDYAEVNNSVDNLT